MRLWIFDICNGNMKGIYIVNVKNLIRYMAGRIPIIKKWMISYKIAVKKKNMLTPNEVVAGETDNDAKTVILQRCKDKYSLCFSNYERETRSILRSSELGILLDEGEINRICSEIMWCYFAYGFQADEFIMFDFIHKDDSERKEYISDIDRYEIYYRNNDFYDRMIFINKYDTYRVYSKYYGRNIIYIENERDYDAFVEFLTENEKVVVKSPALSKGDSVRLIDFNSITDKKTEFRKLVKEGPIVVEEVIRQGKELKKLHPASVNTLRCTTVITQSEVKVFYPFIKMGQSGSFVDNGGKGGILAGIDLNTGVICTDGIDEKGHKYIEHPDSHIVIKGYQLPRWKDCIALVKECAGIKPAVRIVGWDVAWSDHGWIIVEGNAQGQFVGQQGTINRGLKKELLEMVEMR